MFAITEKRRVVDDVEITTFTREVVYGCCFEVEAGTDNKGGDRTTSYFRIDSHGSTPDMMKVNWIGTERGFEVYLRGTLEQAAMIDALEFIVKALKEG